MKQEQYNNYGAEEIRALREQKKMSRKEFGAMLGVNARTIESWEQGLRNPSGAVKKLLEYLR